MSHNSSPFSDASEAAKSSKVHKLKRLALCLIGFLLTVLVGFLLLRILLAGGGERIESLHAFSSSPWLLLFRMSLYVSLWHFWRKLLAMFIKNCSQELVRVTRRPLLVLLICYELFFASNIIGYLI
ncbi:hypothetical protein [Cellvibrio sp. UBA7671]|uniref:hypothetical protein n=1 Tax=Cellvibrio sp. UBA7671 TaxID=1946312 RepID=UPI002F35094C